MKNKKIFEIATAIFMILFLGIFVLSIIYAKEIEIALGNNLQSYGGAVLFLIAFLIELIPNYLSPHIGIINAYALNLNFETTIAFILLGSITGSLIGFELGDKYGTKFARNFIPKGKIKKIENVLNNKGRWGILAAALSPIPYLPIVLGAGKLSWKNFFLFGIVPRSLGIILLTWIIWSF